MGNGEWGVGIRESGVGIRESGFGIRDSGFGTRESGAGSREWGLGTREWGLGNRGSGIMARLLDSLLLMNKPLSAVISSLWAECSLICSNLQHPVSAGGAMRSKGGHILPGIL